MAVLDPAVALDRLKSTARELVALLGNARTEVLRRKPAPDEWAAATVLSHLADAELVYSVRIRMVLTADRPYLAAFDEESWVRRFADLDADPKEALSRWRLLRDANIRLLDDLAPEEWRLSGLHAERGEQTITQIADLLVSHDRDHLAQIRAGLADE
jgi:hypothetical protein